MRLLVVDDNPADVTLVRVALRRIGAAWHVDTVGDGDSALRFLRHEGEHAGAPRPDLVLLDLNIPRLHGHDVLRVMKSEPTLWDIPVLIYSSTRRDDDIKKCYALHANGVIAKAFAPTDLQQTMKAVVSYWGDVNVGPPADP